MSVKFVPKDPINNDQALVQIMVWCRPADKPLSEPVMVRLPMHICVTQPKWVNTLRLETNGCHFADDIFTCIFLNENVWNLIKIWLKFVPSNVQLKISLLKYMYRQVSNIRRTKSQHLKDSRTVLRLSLPNPLKPDVKSRMLALLQLHLSDPQCYCLLRCTYIRGFMVLLMSEISQKLKISTSLKSQL